MAVDAALQPAAPPCVRVAVPMTVPFAIMSRVVAEAAGTMARAATRTAPRIGSFRLVLRTIFPLSSMESTLSSYLEGTVRLDRAVETLRGVPAGNRESVTYLARDEP